MVKKKNHVLLNDEIFSLVYASLTSIAEIKTEKQCITKAHFSNFFFQAVRCESKYIEQGISSRLKILNTEYNNHKCWALKFVL